MKDATETIGTIIGDSAGRDAVHVAVEPVTAGMRLKPGDPVNICNCEALYTSWKSALGIVDPFLKSPVEIGERFWLFLLPRTITGLRHVWTHPSFPDEVEASKEVIEGRVNLKAEAEAWLIDWCRHNNCPDWEDLKPLFLTGRRHDVDDYMSVECLDDDYVLCRGFDAHGEISDEFWARVEIVCGRQDLKPGYFSCSC